jgi:DNA-binding transcriptional LysR family regulator
MADDLDGMTVFVAVAESKGFRAAGERLGVTGSAVSQALSRLEDRLGVPLVQRTTRSVRLTEAGERLYREVGPALDRVRAAVQAVGQLATEPRGSLRLNVSGSAVSFLGGRVLRGFLETYPQIRVELQVGGNVVDIVAEGYDAGVRLGEMIDQDMHVVAASAEQRLVVVGSPTYLARHSTPQHPRDLARHTCIVWRAALNTLPYKWEFTDPQTERDFTVLLEGRVVTNDIAFMADLARAGIGLTMLIEEVVQTSIEQGELVEVLREFSTPFPGFYLYYPQRSQASSPLRALLDYLHHQNASWGAA